MKASVSGRVIESYYFEIDSSRDAPHCYLLPPCIYNTIFALHPILITKFRLLARSLSILLVRRQIDIMCPFHMMAQKILANESLLLVLTQIAYKWLVSRMAGLMALPLVLP